MTIRRFSCAAALLLCVASFASGQTPAWSGPVTDIDGSTGPQYDGPGTSDVRLRYRPMSADATSLDVSNVYIHDVWNQKGIDIGITGAPDGTPWTFKNITVQHYEGARINRDESRFAGYHMDFLRICGAGDAPVAPTDVFLNDIYVHDGDALPIIIQDGNYGTIRLKNIRIANTSLGGVQIATIHSGKVGKVIIEDSPGLHVAMMGQADSLGQVEIINSPGAAVATTPYASYANVLPISGGSNVPEPASLLCLSMVGVGLLRRGRR